MMTIPPLPEPSTSDIARWHSWREATARRSPGALSGSTSAEAWAAWLRHVSVTFSTYSVLIVCVILLVVGAIVSH